MRPGKSWQNDLPAPFSISLSIFSFASPIVLVGLSSSIVWFLSILTSHLSDAGFSPTPHTPPGNRAAGLLFSRHPHNRKIIFQSRMLHPTHNNPGFPEHPQGPDLHSRISASWCCLPGNSPPYTLRTPQKPAGSPIVGTSRQPCSS